MGALTIEQLPLPAHGRGDYQNAAAENATDLAR